MVEKHTALFSLHLFSDPACGRESYIIFTFRTLDFGLLLWNFLAWFPSKAVALFFSFYALMLFLVSTWHSTCDEQQANSVHSVHDVVFLKQKLLFKKNL